MVGEAQPNFPSNKDSQINALANIIPQIMNAVGGGDRRTSEILQQQRNVNDQRLATQATRNAMRAIMSPQSGPITGQLIQEQSMLFNADPQEVMKSIVAFQQFKKLQAPRQVSAFRQLPGVPGAPGIPAQQGGIISRQFPEGLVPKAFTQGVFSSLPTTPKVQQPFASSPLGIFSKETGKVATPAPPKIPTKTTEIKNFEFGLENPNFLLKQKRKDEKEKEDENNKISFKNEKDLRKEFLSQSSEYIKVRDSYTRVVGSSDNPSPAGDLSLIFNYMKMLDPGSVVRESEFATAAASGSFGDRFQAAGQRVLSGERLAPDMRLDFTTKAKVLFDGMGKQHDKRVDTYKDLAIKNNLNPDNVALDILAPKKEDASKVIMTHPIHGDITEADILRSMEGPPKLTREEVLLRLEAK